MTARWLNERERLIAVERLKSNKTGIKNIHHKKAQIKEALSDPKIWLLVAAVFIHNMTNSLQSNFTGLIIKGFGYSTYDAVLLSIPGSAIFAVTALTVSFFLSSKWGEGKRIFAIILCYIPGVVSCAILHSVPITPSTKGVHLFAVFFLSIVATSAGITYSLLASNVAGYTKKTVAGALIVSPQTFLEAQAPKYTTGIAVSLTAFCLNIALFVVLYFVYSRANTARDQSAAGTVSADDTKDLIDAFSDLTDLENKKIRYKK
jgi:ACS family allantoate permease-like MFS transporter